MDIYDRAVREFALIEKNLSPCLDERPIIWDYKDEILALVKKFAESGQSGGSAPYTAGAISKAVKNLCMGDIIGGLTYESEEWDEISKGVYQNTRLSSVFRDEGSSPYYLYSIVWRGEEEYDTFTGHMEGIGCAHYIKSWPFYPKTFYIDVVRERNDTDPERISCGDGDYLYHIKDWKQLEAVWEYYDRRVV